MWDNPGGQLPGTGIRGDGENLHDRRSTQRVRGHSPGRAVLTGESSSGRSSFQVNVSGSGSLFRVRQNGMKLSFWGLLNF